MPAARLRKIANAAHAGLSNVLENLQRNSHKPRAVPLCEQLEGRILFDETFEEHILKFCTPHPVRPTPYCTCDCCTTTNTPQNNTNNSGAAPSGGPTTKGGGTGTGKGGGSGGDTAAWVGSNGQRGGGSIPINGASPGSSGFINDGNIFKLSPIQSGYSGATVVNEGGDAGGASAAGGFPDSASEIGYSRYPVRYTDGQPAFDITDISSDGFGATYGASRSYDPYMADNGGHRGPLGNQWTINNAPYLEDEGTGSSNADINRPTGASDTIVVYTSASNQRFFDLIGSTWTDRYGGGDSLTAGSNVTLVNGVNVPTMVLTDTSGSVTTFVATTATQQAGQFISFKDPGGNVTQVTAYDSTTYNIGEIQRSSGSTIESWKYTYINNPAASGQVLLASVLLRRSTNSGSTWTDVREADYSFYDGSLSGNMAYGNQGDLRSAAIADPNAAITGSLSYSNNGSITTVTVSANNSYVNGDTVVVNGANQQAADGLWVISNVTSTSFTYTINTLLNGSDGATVTINKPFDVSMYRYFTDGGADNRLMHFNIGPQAYARARAAGVDPSTASDTTIHSYADNEFGYNSSYQVSDEWVQGGTVHTQYSYFTGNCLAP